MDPKKAKAALDSMIVAIDEMKATATKMQNTPDTNVDLAGRLGLVVRHMNEMIAYLHDARQVAESVTPAE